MRGWFDAYRAASILATGCSFIVARGPKPPENYRPVLYRNYVSPIVDTVSFAGGA